MDEHAEQWHIRIRGRVQGPFTKQRLHTLARRGQFSRVHEVSKDGGITWTSAAEHPELLDPQAAPATAATPPLPDAGGDIQPPTTDGLDPNDGRKGRRSLRAPMVLLSTGIAAVVAAVAFVWLQRDSSVIDSIQDHDGLRQAVGKVVSGLELVSSNGELVQVPISVGTAFAINRQGAMLTNQHVVEGHVKLGRSDKLSIVRALGLNPNSVRATARLWVFVCGEKHLAKIEHHSSKHDYAIIRIANAFKKRFSLRLTPALQPPRELLDHEVRAVGFPADAGRIAFSEEEARLRMLRNSALHEDVARYFEDREFDFILTPGRVSQVTEDRAAKAFWLQHTASIAGGNSGGPLVNTDCVVLGMNTQVAEGNLASYYRALCVGQFKSIIDQHAPGVVWR